MKVKIYGYGWVGKAMQSLFPDALIHDPPQNLYAQTIADIAFVCVPTPNYEAGWQLDTSIVEEVVSQASESLLIIRSTVNPGDCNKWLVRYNKHIVYMPEYLGESVAHPLLDETKRNFLIVGGFSKDRRKAIELFQTTFNANINIRQTSLKEAEVIKLSENRAIAWKVAQCQELYDACEAANVDYYTVREAVYGDDPRFNLWWTFVYPDQRGMNSKCIPKDVYAWAAWAESCGYEPKLTSAILAKNEEWLDPGTK